jgi:hypothetical protein
MNAMIRAIDHSINAMQPKHLYQPDLQIIRHQQLPTGEYSQQMEEENQFCDILGVNDLRLSASSDRERFVGTRSSLPPGICSSKICENGHVSFRT